MSESIVLRCGNRDREPARISFCEEVGFSEGVQLEFPPSFKIDLDLDGARVRPRLAFTVIGPGETPGNQIRPEVSLLFYLDASIRELLEGRIFDLASYLEDTWVQVGISLGSHIGAKLINSILERVLNVESTVHCSFNEQGKFQAELVFGQQRAIYTFNDEEFARYFKRIPPSVEVLTARLAAAEARIKELEVQLHASGVTSAQVRVNGVWNENLFKTIHEFEFSVRSQNCLQNSGIEFIYQLVEKTEAELRKTKNFGIKSLKEIKEELRKLGLSLGMRLGNDFPQHLAVP